MVLAYKALAIIWEFGLGIWGLGICGVLKVLDELEMNKSAVVEVVEGHVMVAITRLDIVDRVAVVVVVTMVLGV